jgi:transcription antitermination factor NusG
MADLDGVGNGTSELTAPARLWYALRVKSNFERATIAVLGGKGYGTYLPVYRQLRTWSDRTKVTEVPLFPGYVFAQFDVDRRLPVLTTPGVVHVVPPNQAPVAVDEEELNSVRIAVDSGLPLGPYPFLQVGQQVVITRGSMTGLEGILVQVKRTFRLVVSVTLLQRSVAVEIDRDWIRPLSSSSFKKRASVG